MSWPAQLHYAAVYGRPLCTSLHGLIPCPTCLRLREWHKAWRQALGIGGRPLQLVRSLRGVQGRVAQPVLRRERMTETCSSAAAEQQTEHTATCNRTSLTQPARRGPLCSRRSAYPARRLRLRLGLKHAVGMGLDGWHPQGQHLPRLAQQVADLAGQKPVRGHERGQPAGAGEECLQC